MIVLREINFLIKNITPIEQIKMTDQFPVFLVT
jgi:hypothetical protein